MVQQDFRSLTANRYLNLMYVIICNNAIGGKSSVDYESVTARTGLSGRKKPTRPDEHRRSFKAHKKCL
jgi:hypothetical protein